MISALKRALTKGNTANAPTDAEPPAGQQINSHNTGSPATFLNNGMQMISQSLQKKFSRGVNYNMKIVIRGDNNVGKSNLWLRLQGQPFKEVYETSDEIQVANIQWNYKGTDDIVKVEVWDVVDRSKKKKNLTGGGLHKQPKNAGFSDPYMLGGGGVEAALDAEFIDVYKNANGCILVFDITKAWTWDYIERELPKVPGHIPVLVVGNFLDSQHHRAVEQLKCKYFIENFDRGSLASSVRYTETSLRSGFGLKYLYKFFNIPFLQLQRENLMQQLETNAKEMDAMGEELDEHDDHLSEEYAVFSDLLNNKRRQESELNAKDVLKDAKSLDEARKLAIQRKNLEQAKALEEASEPQKMLNKALTTVLNKTGADQFIADSKPAPVSMSVRLEESQLNKLKPSTKSKLNHIHDFQLPQPNEDELNQFLNVTKSTSQTLTNGPEQIHTENEDDDQESGPNNPMVASFQETIDSDDECTNSQVKPTSKKFFDLSDAEEATVPSQVTDTLPPLLPAIATNLDDKAQVPATAQFSAQDFDFLESMTSQKSDPNDETASIKKKKKSSKSKTLMDDVEDSPKKKSTKTKKSKEKKSKKEKKSRESEDEVEVAYIKKDLDYEEL